MLKIYEFLNIYPTYFHIIVFFIILIFSFKIFKLNWCILNLIIIIQTIKFNVLTIRWYYYLLTVPLIIVYLEVNMLGFYSCCNGSGNYLNGDSDAYLNKDSYTYLNEIGRNFYICNNSISTDFMELEFQGADDSGRLCYFFIYPHVWWNTIYIWVSPLLYNDQILLDNMDICLHQKFEVVNNIIELKKRSESNNTAFIRQSIEVELWHFKNIQNEIIRLRYFTDIMNSIELHPFCQVLALQNTNAGSYIYLSHFNNLKTNLILEFWRTFNMENQLPFHYLVNNKNNLDIVFGFQINDRYNKFLFYTTDSKFSTYWFLDRTMNFNWRFLLKLFYL